MSKRSHIAHILCLTAMAVATLLMSGALTEVRAQRDPFAKPGYMKKPTNNPAAPGAKPASPVKAPDFGPPAIEARIEYFKRLRETAAANGAPLPKVTSVLTLSEMAVTGIFKTPRGYAAMVEATPIKLSYTIYPGEKFFDGQLVAVEENRLVFRKVTKVGQGKFVASVENKPLRQYSTKAQLEGTAPSQPAAAPTEASNAPVPPAAPAENPATADNGKAAAKGKAKSATPTADQFASPLDELDKQSGAPAKSDTGAKKKAVKVARTRH